jgi:RNA polymerase sigma-70 factor (ECF subfamily)
MRRREARFRSIFESHYQAVLAYALRRVVEADAHDAVAETFLVGWRRLDDMPPHAELPWLLGVARRTLANQRRSRVRASRLAERLSGASSRDAEADTPHGEIAEALQRLRPLDREVLLLTAWDGLTHREIADVFGCSENAVAIRLHRARSRLARELEAAHVATQGGDSR